MLGIYIKKQPSPALKPSFLNDREVVKASRMNIDGIRPSIVHIPTLPCSRSFFNILPCSSKILKSPAALLLAIGVTFVRYLTDF